MTAPSEHSDAVTEFANARMEELDRELNGDSLDPAQRKSLRLVLRAIGYSIEDSKARRDEHEEKYHQSAWSRWARGRLEPAELALVLGIGGLIVERAITLLTNGG